MKNGTIIEITEDIYYVQSDAKSFAGGILKDSRKEEVMYLYLSCGERMVWDGGIELFRNACCETSLDADMYKVIEE